MDTRFNINDLFKHTDSMIYKINKTTVSFVPSGSPIQTEDEVNIQTEDGEDLFTE